MKRVKLLLVPGAGARFELRLPLADEAAGGRLAYAASTR